jgi:hypothetical protein
MNSSETHPPVHADNLLLLKYMYREEVLRKKKKCGRSGPPRKAFSVSHICVLIVNKYMQLQHICHMAL